MKIGMPKQKHSNEEIAEEITHKIGSALNELQRDMKKQQRSMDELQRDVTKKFRGLKKGLKERLSEGLQRDS